MAVYIPTRARFGNLVKAVPRWLETTPRKCPVILVADKSEVASLKGLLAREGWPAERVMIQPVKNNIGIGAVRALAVTNASQNGFKSIIMSDDDLMPAVGAHMNILLRYARRREVLGIGATRSLHDWLSGGATKENNGPILCPSGWGLQVMGLNVDNAIAVGNFDPELTCWGEDAELMRAGLSHGFPWLVHCGVKVQPIGKRYDPGGLADLTITREARTASELQCQARCHARWPEYVAAPPNRPRVAWVKMYDTFIPGWRESSAMHGGSI